jgi:multiple sugar transport system substrate-binding protein
MIGGIFRGAPVARAQNLTGKITVGFDASSAGLEQVTEAAAATVKTANPGVEIEIAPAPAGNYLTQLLLALSSGRAPDVFVATGLLVGELGVTGLIEPLDRYLAAWDGWPQYPDVVRQAIAYQGKTWGLPYVLDTHFLYFRQDLFEEAGLGRDWRPETPDDILAAARQVKTSLPSVIPYGIYAGANGGNSTAVRGLLPLVYAFGGTLTDETGRWIIDSPAIRRALGYYQTAFQVDKTVPQDAMTAANPSRMLRTAFATGELAMIYDGSWVYGDWDAAAPQVAREQTGYVLFPTAFGGPPFTVGGLGNSWYVNAKSKSKDLAWALVAAANVPAAHVALNAASPHIPPRQDAAADPAFAGSPFLTAMVGSLSSLILPAPDPAFRQLIGIIQNATGIVATGEATPEEAVKRYGEEMTRILGEDRIVKQV